MAKLYQLPAGSWVDPNKVDAVYIGWKFKQPPDLPRVELSTNGVRLVAFDEDKNKGVDDMRLLRDKLAKRLQDLRKVND